MSKKKSKTINNSVTAWRNIIEPHPDVTTGNFYQSEFAADLGNVASGESTNKEYADPVEFFARTYLTGGLKKLLVEVLKRVYEGKGEPVIQLKTSFGGGKTHSLLALYHLFGGKIRAEESSNVREILNAAGLEFIPKVNTAVIAGQWKNSLDGTLWGEITKQLAKASGKEELYKLIERNDKEWTAPGVGLLKKIFDAAGACLILLDELIVYGKTLSGSKLDNFTSFIQQLTEAANASPKCAVVVSIPQSEVEIGKGAGEKILAQVEKTFGRVEFVWTPITNVEGYEIVRRRLFKNCDEDARKKVCTAFFNMYKNNKNDFPFESYQESYLEKLLACYPIHPLIFDYFYDKWTSLEGFQKTRGVLRLMAQVIYYFWNNNDSSALIMPGNIPLESSEVHGEFAKLLGGNWDSIINSEIDGKDSAPFKIDMSTVRFGKLLASRKIARTIFLGTAPDSKKSGVRGVTEKEIHLGIIEPADVKEIATYNDALSQLKTDLYYLYSKDTRYWFNVNPTIRKYFYDKRGQFSNDEIEFEIEKQLKTWRQQGEFKGVHFFKKKSEDIPDEKTVRLVILPPKYFYVENTENNKAFEIAKEILEKRGEVPRQWKNMLMFMAAESEKLATLKEVVRDYLAWQKIIGEKKSLNLDEMQFEDAENNCKEARKNFIMKISQAYCKIFAPQLSNDGNLNVPMEVKNIDCTNEENISAASKKFVATENLLTKLGIEELLRLLDKFIWRANDGVQLKKLWEYFATFYYLPRLAEEKILLNTVKRGVEAKIFALSVNEDFTDLKFGNVDYGQISPEFFLVKAELAKNPEPVEIETPEPAENETVEPAETEIKNLPPPLSKYFSMDVELDKMRYAQEIKKYMDEIASFLMSLPNAKTSIRLSINISIPEGVPPEIKETVESNCNDLKIKPENFHFES